MIVGNGAVEHGNNPLFATVEEHFGIKIKDSAVATSLLATEAFQFKSLRNTYFMQLQKKVISTDEFLSVALPSLRLSEKFRRILASLTDWLSRISLFRFVITRSLKLFTTIRM